MNKQPSRLHAQRISRVCEYIYQNLDSDLSLEQLSEIGTLSKFHFHRVFHAIAGVNVGKFILMLRLRRASFRLAFEAEKRVIDIALEAGFEGPEAFARAFKRAFNQTPSEFRAQPAWPEWYARFQFEFPVTGDEQMNVKIIDFPTTKVALLEHLGPPELVNNTAKQFIEWRKATGLSPIKTSNTYGIPYGDPRLTAPEEFRWDVCGSIDKDVPANDYGVKTGFIPGGRCAVFRHKGSRDSLDQSIYPMYRDWLPGSGEELRDFPCFFQYINFVHEVNEHELLTDIFLPIK